MRTPLILPLLSTCLVRGDGQVNEMVEVALKVILIEMGMHLVDCILDISLTFIYTFIR